MTEWSNKSTTKWFNNYVWIVLGEDEKTYGCFLVHKKAVHLKRKLEELADGCFRIETYSVGPSPFFAHLMNDYKEK